MVPIPFDYCKDDSLFPFFKKKSIALCIPKRLTAPKGRDNSLFGKQEQCTKLELFASYGSLRNCW
jgi:hypothetical protein